MNNNNDSNDDNNNDNNNNSSGSSPVLLSSSLPVQPNTCSVSPRAVMSSSLSEYEGLSRNRSSSGAPALNGSSNTPRMVANQDDEQIRLIASQRRNQRARERQIGRAPRLPPSVTMSNISAVFPHDLKNDRVKIGHADMQGRRPTMEDATTIEAHYRVISATTTETSNNNMEEVFVGVYDGHGGTEAAHFVGKELHLVFKSKLDQYQAFLQKRQRIESGEEVLSEEELCELSHSCNRMLQCVPRSLGATLNSMKARAHHGNNSDHAEEAAIVDESSVGSISIDSLSEQQVIPILLREAFLETNERVCYEEKIQNGCTASSVYLRPVVSTAATAASASETNDNCLELYVANVGDSRVVLSKNGKAVRLTVDHRPNDPDEQRRVKDAGGHIINQRVNAILAVTRAIGDVYLQPIVTSDPHTCFTSLSTSAGDEFLIIACDGIWDVVSDQDAVDLIKDEQDPRVASVKLRDHAYSTGSTDNISVAVVRLRKTVGNEEDA